jgi:predicted metal-binding membrane protein
MDVPPRRHGPVALLWAATAAAWLAVLAVPVLGGTDPLRHHGSGSVDAGPTSTGGQLAAWMLMVVAMMLPVATPALRGPGPAGTREHQVAVLVAYLGAWLGFGAVWLVCHGAVRAAVTRWTWLDQRPTLAAAGALAVAGLYQFTPVKRRCLTACRDPGVDGGRRRPGPARGWCVGLRLATLSLGSCWALMLVMSALGGVVAMVAPIIVVGAEASPRWGSRLAGPCGVVLLYLAAALTLAALAEPLGGAAVHRR